MLNNATEIISNVPGRHLNPLLLAQSQWNDSSGFMMIAYAMEAPTTDEPGSRFYDLFFLRGSHIHDCARLNCDLRFQLQLDVALQTFGRIGREENTRVFLFAASEEVLNRFRSTFYYEPCLKVQLEGLSGKQIHRLLASTKCKRGIIECNDFAHPLPSIHLKEITSADDIIQYRPPFRHGRILIYDTDRNKQLLGLHHDVRTSDSKTISSDQTLTPAESINRRDDVNPAALSGSLFSPADEKEAEEFSAFITKFLDSQPLSRSEKSVEEEATSSISDNSGLQSVINQTLQPSLFVVSHRMADDPASIEPVSAEKVASPPIHGRDRRITRKPRSTRRAHRTTGIKEIPPQSQPSEFVRLFERLFRSFRQQAFEVFGNKSDTVIAEAESKVRFLNPEFDLHALNETTAILVLDIIETTAVDASFMKRSRLRQAALALVADLYNKQYELLESNRAIDKVEQFYYKLKK